MTNLLVDIGNSALKLASFDEIDKPKAFLHADSTHVNPDLFKEIPVLSPRSIYACSVANQCIKEDFEKKNIEQGIEVSWFHSERNYSGEFRLTNEYDSPESLGADRWFASLGAVYEYPERSIVLVQFGTATTVDSILYENGQYRFLGGCIAPGIQLMFSSLAERIPRLKVASGIIRDFPKNTEDAISTGIINCQIGVIWNAFERLSSMDGRKKVQIVLTGGGIESFSQLHRCAREQLPNAKVNTNLVLKGLKLRVGVPSA